jgi:signal peptidase II
MESAPTRDATRARAVIRPRDGWFIVLTLAIIGADQAVKWVIRETVERGDAHAVVWPLKIVHVTNSGAAFGMFQGAGPLLVMTSILGMAAIVVFLFNPSFAHPLMRLGLALMLGGAVGNLIDRVKDGEVVDFIKVPNFPAFNVADSAITIGVLVLVWAMLREPQQSQPGD